MPLFASLAAASVNTYGPKNPNRGGPPAWVTAAGSLGSDYTQRSSSFTPSAPGATSFSLVSGSLPTGHSLNTSTGVISGTASGVADYTSSTFNFTLRATNGFGFVDRAFSITIASRYVGFRCIEVGEGGTCADTAPAGMVFNRKDFSAYGTPGGTCGAFTIGGCNSSASNSWLPSPFPTASYSIGMSNGVWGDPCGGTFKSGKVQMSYGPF